MSVTITCPKCQAALKAKNAPPPNQAIQCPRCKNKLAVGEKARPAKSSKVASPITKTPPKAMPIEKPIRRRSGFGWQHGVVAGVVALVLVGGGVAGTLWMLHSSEPTPKSR